MRYYKRGDTLSDLVKFLYCSDKRLRLACSLNCEVCDLRQKTYTQANLSAVCYALGKLLDESGGTEE